MRDPDSLRILLLGANGQLGFALNPALSQMGRVRALTRADLDLADAATFSKKLQAHLQDFQPQVIVNAAAYTAVDLAQSETDLVWQVNAHAVRELAAQAHAVGCMLVHYSSDYVFDGSGTQAWREEDAPHPLSVYGQSKLAGEQAIANQHDRAVVLRTSWVVGGHGNNFLKTILRLANEKESLRVVSDQMGAPTSVRVLAQVTVAVITQCLAASVRDAKWGLYHVAAAGETSWYGYALHAVEHAWSRGAVLRLRPSAIEPIRTEDYPLPAPRPRNSRLNTDKLRHTFALDLPSWKQEIEAVVDEILGVQQS